MPEKYYFGQGEVELAEITAGVVGPYVWIGDVSELTGQLSQTPVQHRESFSGKNALVREFFRELGMTWNATLHQLDVDNIARFTLAKTSSTVAGTASAEAFPNPVANGDKILLDNMNVSALVITDSLTPTPATLVQGTHYDYDVFGQVEILALPTAPAPTQPLLAAYSYGATKQAAFLAGERKYYSLRYKGKNLAENGELCMVELYKVSAGLLQSLSLITSGNQLAGSPVTFGSLLDTSKPASGDLGQYGRFVTLG